MVNAESRIVLTSKDYSSKAIGYMDAIHGLCINCHREVEQSSSDSSGVFTSCAHCHQPLPDLKDEVWKEQL